MSNDVLKYLSDKAREEIEVMTADMARGAAKDFGAYQYACGIVRGLSLMNGFIADVAARLEDGDDD